eukprot:CAMPEP_0170574682 /NCGR_PEP_ID=MMETSP0224-20130122/3435_1 /TAXON_ID=285029 /ORGANISM="Togula jolla, Strain CCCM 725" /LENGTH=90 /DNA_ID=CAMNT_0010897365 /DNA_START=1764 /DNA_END=2037 /DNA_ORIENTATION=+
MSETATDGVDENALGTLKGLLDEAEDLIRDHVTRIEDSLTIGIHPAVSEVDNADGFPMVRHLAAAAVDHSSHFVGNHKLEILCSQLVADK